MASAGPAGMRSSCGVLLLLGLGACVGPIEIDLDPDGGGVVLYDDGDVVRVAGCPNRAFLGCEELVEGDAMTVTADGTTYDVPPHGDGHLDDQVLGALRDGPLQLTIPRPADGVIDLTLAGVSTSVRLPDSFTVTPPPPHVVRSAGPIVLEHEMLPGATSDTLAFTTCGDGAHFDLFEETSPGSVEVALDAFASQGACSHELHVDQTLSLDAPGLAVTGVRIVRVVLTSDP